MGNTPVVVAQTAADSIVLRWYCGTGAASNQVRTVPTSMDTYWDPSLSPGAKQHSSTCTSTTPTRSRLHLLVFFSPPYCVGKAGTVQYHPSDLNAFSCQVLGIRVMVREGSCMIGFHGVVFCHSQTLANAIDKTGTTSHAPLPPLTIKDRPARNQRHFNRGTQ